MCVSLFAGLAEIQVRELPNFYSLQVENYSDLKRSNALSYYWKNSGSKTLTIYNKPERGVVGLKIDGCLEVLFDKS